MANVYAFTTALVMALGCVILPSIGYEAARAVDNAVHTHYAINHSTRNSARTH